LKLFVYVGKERCLRRRSYGILFLSGLIRVDSTLGEEPLTIIALPIMILRTSSLLVFFLVEFEEVLII